MNPDWNHENIAFAMAMVCFVVFSLLCLIRKIGVFKSTSAFANAIILFTVLVCMVYGGIQLNKRGSRIAEVEVFN